MSLLGMITNYKATIIRAETDECRRAEYVEDFVAPDPRVLAESCGVQNNCFCSPGLSVQSRVSEALCLLGNHSQALAYTEPDAVCMVIKRHRETTHVAVCRGVALAALGRTDAAKAVIESAISIVAAEKNLLGEALALRALLVACGTNDDESKMRRARG